MIFSEFIVNASNLGASRIFFFMYPASLMVEWEHMHVDIPAGENLILKKINISYYPLSEHKILPKPNHTMLYHETF